MLGAVDEERKGLENGAGSDQALQVPVAYDNPCQGESLEVGKKDLGAAGERPVVKVEQLERVAAEDAGGKEAHRAGLAPVESVAESESLRALDGEELRPAGERTVQ
ncbi:hypothetical protein ZWY2020_002308 [Hordeum vulgare]|nr:hypothetical protein ZWY2020_002308 [Hordeum vulgare]